MSVKPTVSLPERTFARMEVTRDALGLSRSAFVTQAVDALVDSVKHRVDLADTTEGLSATPPACASCRVHDAHDRCDRKAGLASIARQTLDVTEDEVARWCGCPLCWGAAA